MALRGAARHRIRGPARRGDPAARAADLTSLWPVEGRPRKQCRRDHPGGEFETAVGKRRPFLTAKRLLSNQTFRDIYRTDTLDIDQRLKITSLTFLFTDLKGSTELYERVGDLVAFDLVREHFHALQEIVAAEGGAVVKTIGDAVMATFPSPDRAVAAALRMRQGMRALNATHGREDLLLKIGIHEGPCLAVTLNERQDYFGQTVNLAARLQGQSRGGDVVLSQALAPLAEAAAAPSGHGLTRETAMLRGLAEPVAFARLAVNQAA